MNEFNNRIIYLAITDVFRDCFGIAIALVLNQTWIGYFIGAISISMLIQDLFSIYMVLLQKPFIFFNSPDLEQVIFWWIMLGDFAIDFSILFVVFYIWINSLNGDDSISVYWWTSYLMISSITFIADIEQIVLKVGFYD